MASTSTVLGPVPAVAVYGDPHFHTEGDVIALTFGRDGTLWSVEEPGVVRHWHAGTGQQLACQILSDLETLWNFNPDGRFLASASDDVSLWDPEDGRLLTVVPQPCWVTALAFHKDTRVLATGHDDGTVRLWDCTGPKLLHEFHPHKLPVSALAISPNGTRLASAAEDCLIALWDLQTGQLVGGLEGHTDRIPALAWHPEGQELVSAGWDTTARVWDTVNLRPVILLNAHAAQVQALAFSPDGALLACADSARDIHVWNYPLRKTHHVLKEPDLEVRHLAFSPDGQRLACGGAGNVVHLWDPVRGQPLSSSAVPGATEISLSVSPDGRSLVTNNGGSRVRVWDVASRQPRLDLSSAELVHAVAWSPDNRWIAGGTQRSVLLWEADTGRLRFQMTDAEEPATVLAFSPDGKRLASAWSSGLQVWLWDPNLGEPVLLIPDALDGCTVEGLAFVPGGGTSARRLAVAGIDWLATSGSSGAVSIWDLQDRCEVATFLGGSTAVACHPNGRWLAAASLEQAIFIWDLQTQALVTELTGHEGPIHGLAFCPDGTWLVSGGDDWTLRLWEVARWNERSVLEMDGQIKGICFAPDGQALFTAHGNTTCQRLVLTDLLNG